MTGGNARRWASLVFMLLLLIGGMGWLAPTASAGRAATIVEHDAPLYRDHDDRTVLLRMEHGTRVDFFYGPHSGMYEIRYHGTVGWAWISAVAVDGSGGSAASSAPAASASVPDVDLSPRSGGERWVDVDRANGRVALMEGDTALYVFWGSLGRDQGEGYYATAAGTYWVFAKNRALTYTPFADNYITHWVGFDPDRRNGFHSYTKDANGVIVPGGGGYTAGCVSLPPGSIEVLYDFAFIGMRVEIHW